MTDLQNGDSRTVPLTKDQLSKRRVVAEEDSFVAFTGDGDDFAEDDF